MSSKEAITNKRPRVSTMDNIVKDEIATSDIIAQDIDDIDLGRFSKREAPSLEAFLSEPTKYRPRPEFLGGAASYVEVTRIIRKYELIFRRTNFLNFTHLSDQDETILTHAVKIQNGAAVAALLEAGADPNFANKKGVTPISAAAHKGNTEIMSSLIDAGSNVNACNSSGSTALIQVTRISFKNA